MRLHIMKNLARYIALGFCVVLIEGSFVQNNWIWAEQQSVVAEYETEQVTDSVTETVERTVEQSEFLTEKLTEEGTGAVTETVEQTVEQSESLSEGVIEEETVPEMVVESEETSQIEESECTTEELLIEDITYEEPTTEMCSEDVIIETLETSFEEVTEYVEAETLMTVEAIETEVNEEGLLQEYYDEVLLIQNGNFISQHVPVNNMTAAENEWQQIFVSRIQTALDSGNTKIDISDLKVNRLTNLDVLRKVYRSCITGDRFYLSGGFRYSCTNEGIIVTFAMSYYSEYCDANGDPDIAKIEVALSAFNKYANDALLYASAGRNTLEVVLLIHDWIVRECDYAYEEYLNQSLPKSAYNAYGVFVNRRAVCNGYAIAYSYLLSRMGIESYIAASDSMNHAWNLILIDGTWYHTDATYDDPVFGGDVTYYGVYNADYSDEGFVYHKYFLKSDKEFEALDHTGWMLQNSPNSIPEANKSNAFLGSLFANDERTAFGLIDGKWYFEQNASLYCSDDLWGNGLRKIPEIAADVYYVHIAADKVYFMDFASVYSWTPTVPAEVNMIVSADSILECSIKNNQLVYTVLNDSIYERHTRNLSELNPMLRLPKPVWKATISYETKVKLVWEAETNAEGYLIEYKAPEETEYRVLKRIDDSEKTSYNHTLKNGGEYVYRFRSFIQNEDRRIYSEYSDEIYGDTLLKSPANLQITWLSETKIEFSWNPVEGADGYLIYEKSDESGKWTTVKKLAGDVTQYRRRPASENRYYSVRAYQIDESSLSYGVRSDSVLYKPLPKAPTNLTAVRITDQKIKIRWTSEARADGYVIYCSTDQTTYKILKSVSGQESTSYTYRGKVDETYSFKICSYRMIEGKKLKGVLSEVVSEE